MKRIFKYKLQTIDFQRVEMPKGAEIISIQTQFDDPCVWAIVESDNPAELRTFEIFGTGFSFDDEVKRQYIGTYQLQNGFLVFHCFETLGVMTKQKLIKN